MPKGIPLTEEEQEQRRRAIVDASLGLFLKQGFPETSMREIAEAVGVSKAGLYYHFKDKQDLFLAILTDDLSAIAQIVAAAPDERAALERLLVEAERHRDESGGGTRAPCLVHSDLHGSNLVDGRALWLIDWEYAALADPLHDVASVLAYHPQAAPFAPRLLAALGLAAEPRALAAALWLFQLLVHLWYRARRVAVEPSAADLAAEQGAARALVHNRNL